MDEKKFYIIATIIIGIIVAISVSCSAGSSSGTSWSDLSDVEKDNARWAYYAQQAIDNR